MQKKHLTTLALAALLLCGFTQSQAIAKDDNDDKDDKATKITLHGTVDKVDAAGNTVTIVDKHGAKHELRVTKSSDIEIDRGENQDDIDATLAEVKQGDRVKVKAMKANNGKRKMRLKEMDIYR